MSMWDEMKGLSKSGDGKPRLHHSAFNTLKRCGEQFRRRYVEGEKRPPGFALVLGTGVHTAVEADLKAKRDEGALLPDAAIADVAASGFRKAWLQGVQLTPDEQARGLSAMEAEGVDSTVALATVHHVKAAPAIVPKLLEHWWTVKLDGAPVDLSGVYDVVEQDGTVRDTKTASKAPSQDEAETNEQLTVYAYAAQVQTGKIPPKVVLDVLVKTATPKYERREATRDAAALAMFEARMERYLAVIEAGAFTPADPNDWQCSERFCGYWSSCPFAARPTTSGPGGTTTPAKRARGGAR